MRTVYVGIDLGSKHCAAVAMDPRRKVYYCKRGLGRGMWVLAKSFAGRAARLSALFFCGKVQSGGSVEREDSRDRQGRGLVLRG